MKASEYDNKYLDYTSMDYTRKFHWSIRHAYIKRLMELGVNVKFMQEELEHLDNDKMASLIRGITMILGDKKWNYLFKKYCSP